VQRRLFNVAQAFPGQNFVDRPALALPAEPRTDDVNYKAPIRNSPLKIHGATPD